MIVAVAVIVVLLLLLLLLVLVVAEKDEMMMETSKLKWTASAEFLLSMQWQVCAEVHPAFPGRPQPQASANKSNTALLAAASLFFYQSRISVIVWYRERCL